MKHSTVYRIMMIVIIMLLLTVSLQAQDSQAWSVLGLVNNARAGNGTSALAMNSRLVAAAQRHSNDMAVGDFMSHTGSDGSEFWQRMSDAGYAMTAGAENILYRWDLNAAGAFQQWRDSPPHNANMMNATYQEVGIAYTLSASGKYYYTMVLGSCSDFVPVTQVPPTAVPPTSIPPTAIPPTAIPPTAVPPTQVPPTAIPPTVIPPTAVPPATIVPTMIPPTVIQPTNTQPVVVQLPTLQPTNTQQVIVVQPTVIVPTQVQVPPTFIPPTVETLIIVNPTAIAPTPVPVQTMPPATQDNVVVMDNPPDEDAIFTRIGELIVRALLRYLLSDSEVVETPVPVVQAPTSFAVLPTMTPTLSADLRLEYDYESFSLINVSGRSLWIEGLSFESSSGVLSVDQWDTEHLSSSLQSFPAGDCLQAWGVYDDWRGQPDGCSTRHGWASVGDQKLFWRGADVFRVLRYGEPVTACIVALGFCEVNLENRLTQYPTIEPVVNTQADANQQATTVPQQSVTVGAGDVRLVYSPLSFTLINTSGHDLDLTGLGFSSASGIMNASRWDTEYLSRPLYAFPAGDCLQAWSIYEDSQPKPAECNVRHGWFAVGDDFLFWIDTDYFSVSRGGMVLATCRVSAGICDLDLP